jgi:hypothetical protein
MVRKAMGGRPIENYFVALIIIAEIIMTLNTLCQHVLKLNTTLLSINLPSNDAASFSIHKDQDVILFFSLQ